MSGAARVVVVGLGPAGADLVLPAARAAIAAVEPQARFVRTARHPAVDDLAASGLVLQSFDAVYDVSPDVESVYRTIVERLVDAARLDGTVVYAVPGSPAVAERTVVLLREHPGVEVEEIPGVSFVDLVWSRARLDPLAGARLVDGHRFAVDAAGLVGVLVVAQCDTRDALSEVKLALLDALDASHDVVVLQRLGCIDEAVVTVALEDLDRVVDPDHLTTLVVDTGTRAVAPEVARLVELARRLRGPGGCPWDAAQTHHTLRRHVLEEAYEVAEAIEALPIDAPGGAGDVPLGAYDDLADELGDLLFQVVIHTVLAEERAAFTLAEVAEGIHDKLVRRHPHVFGDVEVRDADEVVTNWEQIKQDERGGASLVAGIGTGLPALLAAQKLLRKEASVGLAAPDAPAADEGLRAAVDALAAAGPDQVEAALGRVLGAVVAVGRARGLDGESALAGWVRRRRDRFQAMEALATTERVDLAAASAEVVADLWARAAP
ncbi:MAG TPA: MazG family protein [Acidimicrobiia bacterium]|nr:MazG family protein [Acidimicrobiia bacterium]